jgi:UDP-GlcNAc:undecaprenyl-phosphate/decaprenyl-phosphate GlcNAc-1-phosphate transferase
VLVPPLLAGGALATTTDGADVALVVVGVALGTSGLGLIDDLYGDRRAGGFLGHARELLRGHVTTGFLKAAGGGVAGLLGAWGLGWRGLWLLVAGSVIALSSNLANLFDVRPARTAKVWFAVAGACLVLILGTGADVVLAAVAGAAGVVAWAELRERVMLGDVGAGLLGAALGTALVGSLGERELVIAVVALGSLTLLSEFVSFTRVIERTSPLRWLDHLGRIE